MVSRWSFRPLVLFFIFLHFCVFLLFLCIHSWRLGGGFVRFSWFTLFVFLQFFVSFGLLRFYSILLFCTNSCFLHFCVFCTFLVLYFVLWLDSLYEFPCKIWSLYLKNAWVMSTFVLFVLLYFVWTVNTNFHAKSGVCSSKNEWVMLNLAKWLMMNEGKVEKPHL